MKTRLERYAPYAACLLGIGMVFHPTLMSGFSRIQTDVGDSRLVAFILEHSWKWLTGKAAGGFWDLPEFYPTPGVGAWCENLIGVLPLYWVWRAVGLAHDTAFQMWMLALAVLNFTAAYRLLAGPGRCSRVGSSAGAFIFAFAAIRTNQLCHHQMYGVFYTAWAVHALVRLAHKPSWPWALALAGSVSGQLLAGIYLGWFLVFGVALYAVAWLSDGGNVARAVKMLPYLVAAAWVSLYAVWPVIGRYREVGKLFPWGFGEVYLPTWRSWLSLGPGSWLYWWTTPEVGGEVEHRLGLGVVTTVACLMGLAHRRSWTLLVSSALLVGVSLYAWPSVFAWFPGGSGIRTASRVGELLLVPAAFGVAYAADWLRSARWGFLAALLAAIALEQGVTTASYDKRDDREDVERLARQLRDSPDCRAFLFSPIEPRQFPDKYQIDAMWAALETGVPTVNGYSSHSPQGWMLSQPAMDDPQDDGVTRQMLEQWEAVKGLPPWSVCVIRADNG